MRYEIRDIVPPVGIKVAMEMQAEVGWCRLLVSKPTLKAPTLSVIEPRIS
jgi:hypothetical protein